MTTTKKQLEDALKELPQSYYRFAETAIEDVERNGLRDELAMYLRNNPQATAGRILGRVSVLSCYKRANEKLVRVC